MRLVICRQCNHLSGVFPELGGIHSCECVPEHVVMQFPDGYDHYREMSKQEAKFLADYVAEKTRPNTVGKALGAMLDNLPEHRELIKAAILKDLRLEEF